MTTTALTMERALNAASGLGCELYGWKRVEMGWYRKEGYHTIWARDATPADLAAIVKEIVVKLLEKGFTPEWSDGVWFWNDWIPEMDRSYTPRVVAGGDEDFDTAAVLAAEKVRGEG